MKASRTWVAVAALAPLLVAGSAPAARYAPAAPPATAAAASAAPAGALQPTVDLASAAVPRLDGASPGGGFGGWALAAGDLDGDRAPDLVVGAPEAAGTRGELYCFFGRPGALPSPRDLSRESADLTVVGPAPGARLGVAAAVVDLDGDGAGELVVAAGGFVPSAGRLASGGALVFRGGTQLRERGRVDLAAERADAAVAGARLPEPLGAALAAGDFDGDGYPDLALAAPTGSSLDGATRAGRVAVLFGAHDLPDGVVEIDEDPRVALVAGAAANDGVNMSIAVADLTGDGVDDLAVGTPNRTVRRAVPFVKAGEVSVVAGRDPLGPGARVDLGEGAAFRVLGSDNGDYFGRAVAAGDATGDGVADVVASAIDGDGVANGREPDCGELFVVASEPARPAGAAVDLFRGTPWMWVIGDAPRRFLGTTVAAGDLDGDRRAEAVAVSRSAPTPNGAEAGVVYVAAPAAGTLDLASQGAASTILGPSTGAALGAAIVVADLDGDGARDLAIGAPGAAGGRGSVFVVAGSPAAPNAPPEIDPVGPVTAPEAVEVAVELHAADPDGDPIRFGVVDRPEGATFEDRRDGTARLVYTRAPGDAATYVVTATATDGALTAEIEFALVAPGGATPVVTRAVYKAGKLKLSGEGFAPGAEVLLNGAPSSVAPRYKPARGRLVLRGSREALGLSAEPGANRVVVVVDGSPSPEFRF